MSDHLKIISIAYDEEGTLNCLMDDGTLWWLRSVYNFEENRREESWEKVRLPPTPLRKNPDLDL